MLSRLLRQRRLPRVAVRHLHRSAAARAPSFSVTQSPSVDRSASTLPVLQTLVAMRKQRDQWRNATVGFVPTMGALHTGHLELVKRAQKECDRVVVSIYVNPTQFGVGEDFTKYPRQLASDVQKLQGLADVVFAPSDALMYRKAPAHATYVTVDGLHRDALTPGAALASAEAVARPTHFRGVATVVTKLFNIVQPQRAYFGAKDGMQCILLRRVARELNQPTRVIVCPTVREPDGLAMSSRNVYLTPEQRAIAPTVYRALQTGNKLFESGERRVSAIRNAVTAVLAAEPAFTIQYVSIADTNTGAELSKPAAAGAGAGASVGTGLAGDDGVLIGGSTVAGTGGVAATGLERLEGEEEDDGEDNESGALAMLSVAVKLGNTRLIDNILLGDHML